MPRKRMLRAGIAALGITASLFIALPSASAESAHQTGSQPGVVEPEVTRVSLVLAHPVQLEDAITLAATLDEKVVAYAFDNGAVTGEYSPASDALDDYLKFFAEDYGTAPQVNALVVYREVEKQKASGAPAIVQTDLGVELAEYAAPAVKLGGSIAARTEAAQIEREAEIAEEGGASLVASLDWHPNDTYHTLFPSGSTHGFFAQQFYWYDSGLYLLPNNIGLEFEITEHNNSVALPGSPRPLCADTSYKDRFWVSNYSYSWAATDVFWSPGSSPLGAYADYNDLLDPCSQNSIAIGLRYPKNLTTTGGAYDTITLDIILSAPRGLQSSSKISGNIQAVSSLYCSTPTGSGLSLTDCMGVQDITAQWGGVPAGVYNQSTLNISRNWSLPPSRCWYTWDKGTVLDVAVCP